MENRITEQASAYDDLQRMSVHDILTGINREDARVHEAVRTTIPVMERLVERIVARMQRGGRMFYIGAGTSGRLAVTDASELPPTYGVPFDRVIGLAHLRAIHMNDSKNPLGARKDRHACLGEGCIGLEALKRVATHPALHHLPMILETPNELPGYAREIQLLRQA